MGEDSRLDLWLDVHPKVGACYGRARRWTFTITNAFPNWWECRKFNPGTIFLEHGSVPAVVIRRRKELISSVSLIDGHTMSCDIFNCEPETITLERALALVTETDSAER